MKRSVFLLGVCLSSVVLAGCQQMTNVPSEKNQMENRIESEVTQLPGAESTITTDQETDKTSVSEGVDSLLKTTDETLKKLDEMPDDVLVKQSDIE